MAPKKKNKGRGRCSKTPGQTSESDPKPTVTSPSASTPTGDATTASLLPSSGSPSALRTTTTQLIPSAPPLPSLSGRNQHPEYPLLPFFPRAPQITSLLPSSLSHITAITQPLPSAPPLLIPETHQEGVSCTSDGATATDQAGPSTTPSASAASTDDFISLFAKAVEGAMAAVQSGKEEDPVLLQVSIADLYGLRLDEMESILECFRGLVEKMKGDAELKATLEALADVEMLKYLAREGEILLAERKQQDGSGGSCGGSEGPSGGPDSGSGEGDGEGGGVSA